MQGWRASYDLAPCGRTRPVRPSVDPGITCSYAALLKKSVQLQKLMKLEHHDGPKGLEDGAALDHRGRFRVRSLAKMALRGTPVPHIIHYR